MELTLYRDETGFAELRPEWNDLLRRSRFDTIFLTWEWQATWWLWLGACRGPLTILAARDNGRLIGIVPLYLSEDAGTKTLQVVGCVEVSDYLDLIIETGQEEAVYSAFLAWLAGPDAPAWDVVSLCNQPAASLAHRRLPELVRAAGWTAEVFQEDVCPAIALPVGHPSSSEGRRPSDEDPRLQRGDGPSPDQADGFEAYLEGLDKKERHEIRRKLRRIEREAPDAQIRFATGGKELDEDVDRFIALHRLSSRAKDAFMTEEMRGFFHAIAQTLAANGWLQLSFLEIGGTAVASYFCFDYANEILVYNSGYDPEASPQLSTGWVLLSRLIQNAIAAGRSRFDFLQGNEDYKYRFGGVDSPVYRTLLRRGP